MADEVEKFDSSSETCENSSETCENSKSRLEYNPKRLIGIDYPGFVQNPSHMIETLGGEAMISKVFSESSRRLALSFRPEDPYARIVCGDPQPSTNLLLRVRRRKKKESSGELSDDNFEYKQEVLGVVSTTYRFSGATDYQYLSSDVKYPFSCVHGLDVLDEEVPLHILPTMFIRTERLANYHFKPDLKPPAQPDDKSDEEPVPSKMRVRQPIYAFAMSYETKEIPHKPHEKVQKIVDLVKDNQVEVIKKLFNIRPIWSRMALEVHLSHVSYGRLKQLLSLVAYYFLNGPWRTLWVKFGYDPRINPGAKIYQTLDFRIGSRLEGKKLPIPRKRNFHRLSIPVLRKRNVVRPVELGRGQSPEEDKEVQQDDDLPYVFTANKLPMHKQMFYQLCDLHIAEIQELISANDGKETECHEKEGWCLPGTIDKIRDLMVQCTVEMVQKAKKQQQQGNDGQDAAAIQWDGHEEVKSFLEMLEGDDDIETYDIFDEDSDNDADQEEVAT